MIKEYPAMFVAVLGHLDLHTKELAAFEPRFVGTPPWIEAAKTLGESVALIRGCLVEVGLSNSLASADRIVQALKEDDRSIVNAWPDITSIASRIKDELGTHKFLPIPRHLTHFYERENIFGAKVAGNFSPTTNVHIFEAGRCLATRRPTAAVFHLMCVLEAGLDSLSFKLKLPYSQKNWQSILGDINAAISKLPYGTVAEKRAKSFYSEVALEFSFLKDAWRNHIAHGRLVFTEERAEQVFVHVKSFMEKIATRLRERRRRG